MYHCGTDMISVLNGSLQEANMQSEFHPALDHGLSY